MLLWCLRVVQKAASKKKMLKMGQASGSRCDRMQTYGHQKWMGRQQNLLQSKKMRRRLKPQKNDTMLAETMRQHKTAGKESKIIAKEKSCWRCKIQRKKGQHTSGDITNAATKPWAPFDIEMKATVARALTRETASKPRHKTFKLACGMSCFANATQCADTMLPTSNDEKEQRIKM